VNGEQIKVDDDKIEIYDPFPEPPKKDVKDS
jgi:hypothetical protein